VAYRILRNGLTGLGCSTLGVTLTRAVSETVSFKLRSLGLIISARWWGLAAKKNATSTFLDEAHAAVVVTEWDRGASGRGWGVERLGGWVEPYLICTYEGLGVSTPLRAGRQKGWVDVPGPPTGTRQTDLRRPISQPGEGVGD
jgi:hypothetical protein